MKKTVYILLIVLVLIIVTITLKNVFMVSFTIPDSTILQKDENKHIKNVVLEAIKDRCSLIYDIDESEIYYPDSTDIIQKEQKLKNKSIICIYDKNFMKTAFKVDENRYAVLVRMKFPEKYIYNFEIIKDGENYYIDFFQLDI